MFTTGNDLATLFFLAPDLCDYFSYLYPHPVLATRPEKATGVLQLEVNERANKYGIYCFAFQKHGRTLKVVVDGRLPAHNGQLAFAQVGVVNRFDMNDNCGSKHG